MFHKEDSSSSSPNGKKYKDVTLRKSDRKQLLLAALEFFQTERPPQHAAATSTTRTDVTPPSSSSYSDIIIIETPSSSLSSSASVLLEDIFLRNGEIYERTIAKWTVSSLVALNETCIVNVRQYYRSPSMSTSTRSMSSSSSSDFTNQDHHRSAWPYSLYPQCVWMKIDVGGDAPNGSCTTQHQIPSIALLSVLPPSLYAPYITYVPSPLSEYICTNGVKHIMRVGLRSLPEQCRSGVLSQSSIYRKIGRTTVVCVQGNPQPICVGILHPDLLLLDSDDTRSGNGTVPLFGPGCPKGGIGVSVVHAYGDDIWRQQVPTSKEVEKMQQQSIQQMTSPTLQRTSSTFIKNQIGQSLFDLGHYGNVGFINGKYVDPILMQHQEHTEKLASEVDVKTNVTENGQEHVNDGDIDERNTTQWNDIQSLDVNNMDDNDGGNDVDTITLPLDGRTASNEPVDMMASPDEILHDAVCRALAKLDIKKDLPMTMATFYAQYVLPNRKDGTTIQLKQTRYKKFSAYVKEQVDDTLLLVGKQVSANNVTDPMGMLIGFDRKHPELIPYLVAQKEETMTLAKAGIVVGVQKRFEIADLYCVPNHFVALLRLDLNVVKAMNAKTEERRGTGMLTAKEVRSILDEYIVQEGLVDASQPDTVVLNGPLTDALYKKKKKSTIGSTDLNAAPPTPLSLQRKEVVKLWMACQESAYALVQVPGNTILKLKRGKPPTITIEVSRRQSNKYVTTVIGLELYDIDLSEFSKDVANRFACASSIDRESTSAATDVVVVQGNLSLEIEALLLSDDKLTDHGGVKGSTYFLPKNSIQIVLKKGVPARKKGQSKK